MPFVLNFLDSKKFQIINSETNEEATFAVFGNGTIAKIGFDPSTKQQCLEMLLITCGLESPITNHGIYLNSNPIIYATVANAVLLICDPLGDPKALRIVAGDRNYIINNGGIMFCENNQMITTSTTGSVKKWSLDLFGQAKLIGVLN